MLGAAEVRMRPLPPVALLALALSFGAACSETVAQAPLVIAGVTAAPGEKASGAIDIAPRNGDAGTTIPFTIVRGRRARPPEREARAGLARGVWRHAIVWACCRTSLPS
jgi:hypothetical protein